MTGIMLNGVLGRLEITPNGIKNAVEWERNIYRQNQKENYRNFIKNKGKKK